MVKASGTCDITEGVNAEKNVKGHILVLCPLSVKAKGTSKRIKKEPAFRKVDECLMREEKGKE